MDSDNRLRVVLFALPGFGNPVLEALLGDSRVKVEAVFTIKYANPFPYYEEKQLVDLCDELGILCYHGVLVSSDEGIELVRKHAPDLIIVATFKQILKQNVLKIPRLSAVNFHASLLPRYRGPCPTNAALINDEKITGITIHYITEKVDEGDILIQRAVAIDQMDNDGRVRQKLARLSGELIPELIGLFVGDHIPVGTPQAHFLSSYAPKPTVEDGYIELPCGIETIRRKIRAYNPLPGTSLVLGNDRVPVDRFELFDADGNSGFIFNETPEAFELSEGTMGIRLFKKTGKWSCRRGS